MTNPTVDLRKQPQPHNRQWFQYVDHLETRQWMQAQVAHLDHLLRDAGLMHVLGADHVAQERVDMALESCARMRAWFAAHPLTNYDQPVG